MLNVFLKHNYELFAISNYYPSAPTYPGAEAIVSRGFPTWDHPVAINGKLVEGHFDWNEEISKWENELSPVQRAKLPLKANTDKMFPKWPKKVLEIPNAEHHNFQYENGENVSGLHMCCPGSLFISGTFDARNEFGTFSHLGIDFGAGLFWKEAVDHICDGLMIPDGGGITINHPKWSKLDREFLLEMLDYDSRILGMEVLEYGANSENIWDWVLSTGRQCYGFFVPDWGALMDIDVFGVNVLVVPERTAEACLRAYRKGNSYGATRGYGELKFTSISFKDNVLHASTDKPAKFQVKSANGVVAEFEGTEFDYTPTGEGFSCGPLTDIFLRIVATAADGCGEVLYSQPFMLTNN
ncbi:MAG: hypothetical protein KBS55_00735 [Bacteroidales bacterium]|nr:hypothetical protein [Candidatus Cryptobacteroides aphodequi]